LDVGSSLRDYVRHPLRSLASPGARWTVVAILLTGILLGLSACGGGSSSEPEPASNIKTLAADDPSIADAQEEAQTGWNAFVASFRKGDDELHHNVKLAMPTADGSKEHIWVEVTSITGDAIEGTLNNDPVGDLGFAYGDVVVLQRDDVEDWAVYRDGELVLGGFSIGSAAGTTTGG
jgi:uncharacterized protein YegJ (DUF2314 family)